MVAVYSTSYKASADFTFAPSCYSTLEVCCCEAFTQIWDRPTTNYFVIWPYVILFGLVGCVDVKMNCVDVKIYCIGM